jgi:hypothetical protein
LYTTPFEGICPAVNNALRRYAKQPHLPKKQAAVEIPVITTITAITIPDSNNQANIHVSI